MGSKFSLLSVLNAVVRRSFTSAGLHHKTVDIDSETTLTCWVSNSLLLAPSPSPTPTPNPKPILLLIHGFGPEATWQWRLQVGPLAHHFDLIVPDLVFFAGSATRSAERSEAFQAACVARLLDALAGPTAGAVSVAGTSYGGFVAYHVARMLGPERVARVVIASSDVLKAEGDDVALRERAGVEAVADLMMPRTAGHLRSLIRLTVHRQPRFLPDFLLRYIIRNQYNENYKEKLELLKGITLGNKEQFQVTPLPQEVLIVWGEHDNIFPLEKAYKLQMELGGKARLEVLKDTGHAPQVEDPEKFNEVVFNFLLGHPKSSI